MYALFIGISAEDAVINMLRFRLSLEKTALAQKSQPPQWTGRPLWRATAANPQNPVANHRIAASGEQAGALMDRFGTGVLRCLMNVTRHRYHLDRITRRNVLTGLLAGSVLPGWPAWGADAEPKPKTVWGIAELFEWVIQRKTSSGHDTADCLQGHLDLGIRHVMWHLGRSTLDYHSGLPTSTRYAGDSRPETKLIAESLRSECSLRAALAFAGKKGMTIYGRLAMNRHYGAGYGGGLRSQFVADHPEWLERDRRGKADETRVCFAVPEYRAERTAILLEAAQIGAHGLCLDFCRQPPMVRYHPLVLDPWLKAGKTDPRPMKPASAEFLAWSRHRCEFVTEFLRGLRNQLRDFEQKSGRKVAVLVRIPQGTFDLNLMEGIDVQTWAKEGLVDEVALDPFMLWDFPYPDTARPYVELSHANGIKIYGGANTTAARGTKPNARGVLERIASNYSEGVDGIALYQTDTPIHDARLKPILTPLFPHLGDPTAVTALLASARKALPEMSEKEQFFGVDNHSRLPAFGHTPISLETI